MDIKENVLNLGVKVYKNHYTVNVAPASALYCAYYTFSMD